MAKMRKIQPKIKVLQTRFKQDPRRMQIEMANLYKREKINPAGGCLRRLHASDTFRASEGYRDGQEAGPRDK